MRTATSDDAPEIASVHIESWLRAYRGIVSDQYLDRLSHVERTDRWMRILSKEPSTSTSLVATASKRVIGFSSAGPSRSERFSDHDGELMALYLHPEFIGKGIGRRLFDATSELLKSGGHLAMFVWVLEANRSRSFYEHMEENLSALRKSRSEVILLRRSPSAGSSEQTHQTSRIAAIHPQ